jgi:hypothetical protein
VPALVGTVRNRRWRRVAFTIVRRRDDGFAHAIVGRSILSDERLNYLERIDVASDPGAVLRDRHVVAVGDLCLGQEERCRDQLAGIAMRATAFEDDADKAHEQEAKERRTISLSVLKAVRYSRQALRGATSVQSGFCLYPPSPQRTPRHISA